MPKGAKRTVSKNLSVIHAYADIPKRVAGYDEFVYGYFPLIRPFDGGVDPSHTLAGTVTGLRWDLTFDAVRRRTFPGYEIGCLDKFHRFQWAIVVVREGASTVPPANWMSENAVHQLWVPEENVLAFGIGSAKPGASDVATLTPTRFAGSTKTMRKIRPGDQLYLVFGYNLALDDYDAYLVDGIIQVFQKL